MLLKNKIQNINLYNNKSHIKVKILAIMLLIVATISLIGCSNEHIDNVDNTTEWTYITTEQITTEQKTEETTTPDVDINNSRFFVEYIDVGQGDSILIGCNEEYMLIDAGETYAYENVKRALDYHNVKTIKYAVGTHPHSDHIGSLASVIRNYNVTNILLSNSAPDTKVFNDLLDAIEEKGLEITIPNKGEKYILGNETFLILGPDKDETFSDENDYSIGIRFDYGETSFYFAGDATHTEQEFMENDVDIDIYKASHHGSKYANSKTFLNATTPEVVIISCGQNNSYKHPHEEFLERVQNIPVYRTDTMGNITVVCDKENYTILTDNQEEQAIMEEEVAENQSYIHENRDDIVYVTANGTKYHTQTCRYTTKNSTQLTLEEAMTQGYTPCAICHKERDE